MEPTVPKQFDDICARFFPGIGRYYPTIEGQLDFILAGETRENLEAAKNFLDELLSGKYDKERLTEIWNSTQSSVTFFDGTGKNAKEPGIVYVFRMLLQKVEDKLAQQAG